MNTVSTATPANVLSSKKGLDEILEKSARLMATKGYHGTSMRDLAQTTGRSLSGLYHYFNNKQELLYLINYRGFSSLAASAKQVMLEKLAPEQQLKKLIWHHVTFFGLHQSEMRVMMFGTHEIEQARSKEISALKHEYADYFKSAVADYIYYRSGLRLDKQCLDRKSYLLFGMMNWVYGWFSTDEHGSVEALAQDIYSTFTNGCVG
jgi:TetR/AcrR family transcriptional regulator, cholesterol catabolism regulator